MTGNTSIDNRANRAACTRGMGLVLVMLLAGLWVNPQAAAAFQQAPTDTLILVGQDPITVADLDAMVLKAHRSGTLEQGGSGLVYRYLEKRVNDLLILQDALAAGMDQEPEVVAFAKDKENQYAIQAYVRDHLTLPTAAPEDSVRAFFDRFYWQIQVRQLSVRTQEEAEDLRRSVMAGADMDSLAKALSVDSKKLRGGLSNLLHWADVENLIRDQVRGVKVGGVSPVFPIQDAYAFVRVEQRRPVDEAVYADMHDRIAATVLGTLRQRAWDDFVDKAMTKITINENMDVLFAVAADSASVLQSNFLKKNDRPAMSIPGGPVVTETDLRKAVSHETMAGGGRPFAAVLAAARRDQKRRMVLGKLASQAGYQQRDEVQKRVDKDWEELLIENYLNAAVASRITFKHEEFEAFYQKNLERFRGPDEVRLEIMFLKDKAQAEEAAQKLAAGADFSYVFKQYHPDMDFTPGHSSFIQITQLSQPFKDQLAHLKVGESSTAVEMPMGWMVFQLAERRPGTVPPLSDVEMDIRKAIYQDKFNHGMNELLDKLKKTAHIVRFEDRIKAYFNPDLED